ncbi:DUF664 domain-containing protein [Demetria terragena]|uniref:mycothiol transferase n=1 Tax=Demetria terragena TaxID=63959 RepID=UPI00036C0268|nr:DUF664 domain-containing protein [Demetria terragena]
MSTVQLDDVVTHVDRALRGMAETLIDLGDDRANESPDLSGANSPFQIVTHCLGVMEFWGGQVIADREVTRDRAAEFTARGKVDHLLDRIISARVQLGTDLADFDGAAPPRGPVPDRDRDDMPEFTRTQGGVLMHIYEELSQHRGHLEVTADLVRT